MPIQKSNLNINFAQGLDTKSDPFQVAPGRFLALTNTIFDTGNLLQKRNGYAQLLSLPNSSNTFLTTFNGNLTAIGTTLSAYSPGANQWVNKGQIQPLELDVLSLIRSNTNQSQVDTAISSTGLVCTVYTDNIPSGGSTVASYKYAIADVVTGQNIVAPTVISANATGSPRVFVLGRYFVIVFTSNIAATNHLQYIAITITNPTTVTAATDISTTYTPASTVAFDGCVVNNSLYIAYNNSSAAGVKVTYLDSTLTLHSTVTLAGHAGTIVSVCADATTSTPIIYVSYWASGTTNGYIRGLNQQLGVVFAEQAIITGQAIANLTSSAQNGQATVFYERVNAYSYDSGIATNFIQSKTVTQAGAVSSATTVLRSVGLASKSFIANSTIYFLAAYSSSFQPTYFLSDSSGKVIAKLAYGNGGGYLTKGLPSVTVDGDSIQVPYLYKDLVQAANKSQLADSNTPVYAQLGINLASFTLITSNTLLTASVAASEIGNNLHLSGGFLWMYDGYVPVEHGFHLYPDSVEVTTTGTGGLITAQEYFYKVTYEWADNQGNIHRSAPSLAATITTTGSTSSNTVNVPTLRITYKTANPVKIVIYRSSVAQQTSYQVTSITVPLLNDTTIDSVSYVDTQADSAILGNNILYTTGGVLENIAAPAVSTMALFDSRLFYISAEDKNLLGFSKQVIETVPVETSDLLSIYVSPTSGAQGSTGVLRALAPLDDKIILFKRDAAYYVNGRGPDNTGANSQYSEPTFITATVGCSNQKSIVFMPNGLMFQSDKGIWLLGRDLSTSFIGAPVQAFTTDSVVLSAVNVPGTNQVRFTMDSGITLMYDYYYGQWGTFTNVPAVSSTLYQNLHTYINSFGQVFQESIGQYLDGSSPVNIGFTTGWMNLAGLQGFERAYFFYLLANYITPHKLTISIAYDYDPAIKQTMVITPDNYSGTYGSDSIYGGTSNYGGTPTLEQWRIFLTQQKIQAFQITLQESYDASYGAAAGAGLTISGINLVVGAKKGYPTLKAARSKS